MTDSATPGDGVHDIDPFLTSGAIRHGAGDWIVPGDETEFADHEGLSNTPLDAFDASHSGSSVDVTIDTGEGFVGGSWVGRDTATAVTLTAQTDNQTVYLGWKKGTANAVVVGLESSFSAGWPRLSIWQFDTGASGVTAARDLRPIGEQIDVRNKGSAAVSDTADHVAGGDVDGTVADAAHADDSDALGGQAPADYLRSDEDDTSSGTLTAAALRLSPGYNSEMVLSPEYGAYEGGVGTAVLDNTESNGYPGVVVRATNTDTGNTRVGLNINPDAQTATLPDINSLSVGGSDALTRADESGLDVSHADTASSANSVAGVDVDGQVSDSAGLGGESLDDILWSRTIALPVARIPANSSAEVPFLTSGEFKIVSTLCLSSSLDTPTDMRLQILTRDGLVVNSSNVLNEGSFDNPVKTYGGGRSYALLRVVNKANQEQSLGASARIYGTR